MAQQVTRKKGKNAGSSQERERSANWEENESKILLDLAQKVQLLKARSDLNFTNTDMGEIHAMFCQKIPGTIRQEFQLTNRLRTLKKEFTFLRRMASGDGWSWNYGLGMLAAPSPEILKQVFKTVGQRFKYFETKKFPYFAKMEELMGERQQTGDVVQVSADGSRTRNNLPDDSDEAPYIVQPVRQVNPNQQGSDSSAPLNGSSDSQKRKSKESGEPLTRVKRVQLASKERTNEIKEMNMTGKELKEKMDELKEIMNELNEIKKEKHNELDDCFQKLDDLNLTGRLRYMCVEKCQFPHFRRYFLRATREQILDHLQYEMKHP